MGKSWEIEIGEPSGNPVDGDVVLSDAVSQRKRKQLQRQEEVDAAEHKTKIAKLKKDETSAEAAVERTGERKDETGGIKVEGSVKLGTIDYQKIQQQQIDDRDELRKQAEEAASRQQIISDDLREKLHNAEMLVLKTSFEAQMQLLTRMIEGNASKGNFGDQLNAAREIAKELGFSQGAPSGGGETIQIELKKLDFEHQVAMRKMAKDDKADEKRWQLELRKLDDEREAAKAELVRQTKKDEFISQAPAAIGTAIAKGLMISGGQVNTDSSHSPGERMGGITAGIGESGEAECTQCHQTLAIGPTARVAVCAGCGAKYHISRVQAESQGEAEEEE